jgi:PAS domain S-box-containing protein
MPGETSMITSVLNKVMSAVAGDPIETAGPDEEIPGTGMTDIPVVGMPAVSGRKPVSISLLLVDDEPALLEIGQLFLERIPGITVTTADSAESALRRLEQGRFDAVVSDYQMPGMDGITFLQEVRGRSWTLPFILFTGKGREDVVIKALNSGADYYLQKGGDPRSLYAELAHKVKRSVEQRRAESALRRKHAILRAILAASPNGIAYVRNRTFQWVNDSLASMLGYRRAELRGLHLENLYENPRAYQEIGNRIQQDLRTTGRSTIITRFRHKGGFSIDTEIHIAPLDAGNLHFGHMILMNDISWKIAAAKDAATPTGLPHLELSPVIEVDRDGNITYYNDAAVAALARFGSRGTLEEFFPPDLPEILRHMDDKNTGSIYRDVRVGTAAFREHITLSTQFQIARLSALQLA